MQERRPGVDGLNSSFVSTGHLPTPDTITALVNEAHARFKSNTDGENSQVYPALVRVPRELFGVCVVGVSGNVYGGRYRSPIHDHERVQAVCVCARLPTNGRGAGAREARRQRNRNGVQFARRGRTSADGRTKPMVNAGAIATTSLVPGATFEAQAGDSSTKACRRFAGRNFRSMPRCTPRPRKPISATKVSPSCCRASVASIATRRSDRSVHQAVLPCPSVPRTWRSWARRSPTAA